MTPIRPLCSLLLTFTISFNVQAQIKKPVKKVTAPPIAKITAVAKFKPPVVRTLLGRNEKESTVTVDEANQLVGLPLKIVDDKNVPYTINSYQFLYRKKSVIENEETGKRENVFTISANRFNATPLPKIWQDNISGGLQKDEELYFFDIVVNDKLNRKFFAPNVKIKVK